MKMAQLVLLVMTLGMALFFLQGNSFADNSSMTGAQNDKVEAPVTNDDAGMKMTTKKMEGAMDSDMEKQMKDGMDKAKPGTMKNHTKEKMNTSMETGKKMME